MPIEILMPALSPTMTEGNLAKWLKKEGDKVKPGDVIAEIETDKATMEVESIDEGVIGKIFIPAGTEGVKVNELIAILLLEGETNADIKISGNSKKEEAVVAAPEIKEISEKKVSSCTRSDENRIFASPLAKRLAEEKNIDLSKIEGTGPHGRVIKDDLANVNASSVTKSVVQFSGRNNEEYTKIPNNNMRKVIAKRLLESKQNIPHFYLSIECNMDNLLKIREEMNHAAHGGDEPLYKLSVNDFIIKASAMALADVPLANASWSDEAILMYNNVDISVAVAIDGGLITPIIKNADQKSISSISNEMKDLAKRAKQNLLAPHEFQGGGFSISNLGMFNIKKFQAIINPPQSCILACGASSKRPFVVHDEIKIAHMADFSISCDHRVVDGTVGAHFLKAFKKYIEHPVLMFV
jgi:pyruvate dehydrogenase E2 component (dihydrolipoamide acetyltransferase)